MSLIESHSQFNKQFQVQAPWQRLRKNGLKFFNEKGLPTRKDEDWKYTSVKSLSEANYKVLQPKETTLSSVQKNLLTKYLTNDFINIVFINGMLSIENSSGFSMLKESAEWASLSDVTQGRSFPHLISQFKAQRKAVGSVRQDIFEALSSAFAWQGVVLEIKKEASLEKPVQIIYFSTEAGKASYPKNFVIVGQRANLKLIETYIGDGQSQLLSQSTEVILKESSRLEYLRVQETDLNSHNVGVTRFFLNKLSTLESLAYATGGLLSRHNLEVYICGSEASARVQGLTMAAGKQHFDSHTLIDHVVGGSQTTQLYKSILNDEAKSVFDGKVLIRPQSQKANSDQLAKALLLSSQAEVDSKPNLEIYADDVKATHGSTVGQLSEEEIFYMLSRAISREKAVEMLSLGFVRDVVYQLSDKKIQTWLLALLKSAYKRLHVS